MRYKYTLIILLTALLVPIFTYSATLEYGEEYTLSARESVTDNLYSAAGTITISGNVNGDALLAGGRVFIDGPISKDVFVVGGDIDIRSQILGDVRVAGGKITIGNVVNGDLVSAGGEIHISSTALVRGDALLFAGLLTIDGTIQGATKIAAGEVHINGKIDKDIRIEAGQKIVIGKNAEIGATLTYSSPLDIEIEEGAIIRGEVIKKEIAVDAEGARTVLAGVFGMFFVVKLLSLLFAALIGVIYFSQFSQRIITQSKSGFGFEVLRGLIALVIIPIVILILYITVIGFYIASLLLFMYVLLILIASIYAGVIFGNIVQSRLFKKDEVTWTTAVLGIVLLSVLSLIPILGWVLAFSFFLVSFGTLIDMFHKGPLRGPTLE